MFSWRKVDVNLDPYFRVVYIMQCVATGAMVVGFCLTWWSGENSVQVFQLLNRSLTQLRARDPAVLVQPLAVLWWLWPVILISGPRSITGILIQPVEFRKLAFASWVLAMMALIHYYANFGAEIADNSPLKNGEIGPGFWLTGSSTLILGTLVMMEWVIRKPDPIAFRQKPPTGKVDDAQRLWEGDYQTCPHCGMLNEPEARSCFNCKNLLFNFDPDA